MDIFEIIFGRVIPIVVIFGSIVSKSLKDKEKIKKERLAKMQTINDEPNTENYISEERVETKMKPKNQNIYQNKSYDSEVYDDFMKVNNYVLKESRDITKNLEKEGNKFKPKTVMEDTSNSYLQFTKNDMVKGIIMAEILGKPKSLTRYK